MSLTISNLQDVRRILVLSLPPSSETLSMIIDCTLDVNESVRKAAYCVIASKFPLQSLRLFNHFVLIIPCSFVSPRAFHFSFIFMSHIFASYSICSLSAGFIYTLPDYIVCVFMIIYISIKLRATILQRGLSDRSAAVEKECFRMMKDEWLEKCCNGDPIELLKFLDVETYESVGETVMSTLLKAGLVKLHEGQTLRNFITPNVDSTEG